MSPVVVLDSTVRATQALFIGNSSSDIYSGMSQAFRTHIDSAILEEVWFLTRRSSGTTPEPGVVEARIYELQGTYGVDAVPGALLATSDPVDVADISQFYEDPPPGGFFIQPWDPEDEVFATVFTFTGGDRITLARLTEYVCAINVTTLITNGSLRVDQSNLDPHGGNFSLYHEASAEWQVTKYDNLDLLFQVHGTISVPQGRIIISRGIDLPRRVGTETFSELEDVEARALRSVFGAVNANLREVTNRVDTWLEGQV